MNKFNLKNEILTASKMQSIKGGDELPVRNTNGIFGISSGSDPRPKPPTGGIILGSMQLNFQGTFSVQQDKGDLNACIDWD